MKSEEYYSTLGYILASEYRREIIKTIGEDFKIPSDIAKILNLNMNYVSKILNELKNKNVVFCVNDYAKKGRIYKLTDLGLRIYGNLK